MKLFNKKYVYLEWDDKLKDKDCILAHSYEDLKDFVNSGDKGRICKAEKGKEKPFTNHWSECDFCYFDPNWEIKKSLLRNEKVQYYSSFDKWQDLNLWESAEDYLDNEDWDEYEWRIKPTDEQYFVCLYDGEFRKVIMMPLKYIFFKGTEEECDEWIKDHQEMKQVMLAWLNNKQIEIYETVLNKWIDARYPSWDKNCSYRVKSSKYYVVFPTERFLVINEENLGENPILFFGGTYDECYKWIDNHKSCEKICKAKLEGKSIEYRAKSTPSNAEWHFATCSLNNYDFDYYDYRVKPKESTRRMTNRELARWIVEGNGEWSCYDTFSTYNDEHVYSSYTYRLYDENKEVNSNIRIRKWDSDEWREPLVEVE